MTRPFYTTFAWAYDLLIAGPVESRVAFIAEQLRVRGVHLGAHLLDAGCGTGAYSLALAQRGFMVTGIDRSANLIAEARKKAEKVGHGVRFSEGDILSLAAGLQVDAILCRGVLNDLVEEDSRRRVFHSFASVTHRRGVLILDVREWHSTVARKTDNPVFKKTVETERGRLTFRSVTELRPENQCLLVSETHSLESPSGRQTVPCDFVMRCWTEDELTGNLAAAGFESVEYFGDYDATKPIGATDRRSRHDGKSGRAKAQPSHARDVAVAPRVMGAVRPPNESTSVKIYNLHRRLICQSLKTVASKPHAGRLCPQLNLLSRCRG
jgi:ubiquinone/menaquinone biosynthesis C-methylase UbiE